MKSIAKSTNPWSISTGIFLAGLLLIGLLTLTGCPNPEDEPEVSAPALAGTVRIDGSAQVGATLTANIALTEQAGTLTFQWKAENSDVGTDQNSYRPVAADVGNTITVTVTASGNTGSVTSAPTTAVVVAPSSSLDAATITNASNLTAYITANCAGGTEQAPKVMSFTGAITAANLVTVRNAVNRAETYVIWDLSEITGSLTATAIGNTIDADADTGRDRIKGLVVPAGFTYLDGEAFYGCTGLTSVTLPAGLTAIGDRAFQSCADLQTVVFGGSMVVISDSNNNTFPCAESGGTSLKTAYERGKTGSNKGVAGTYTRTPATSATVGSWRRN
jgi:hypothetical protein